MKSILITGATGFLGGYLIKELSPTYKVFALGRNTKKKAFIDDHQAIFCPGDFVHKQTCEKYFENMDYVIHAGALSSAWGDPQLFYDTNVIGTRNVAELCRKYHVKRLIFISSPSIYSGKEDRFGIHETQVDVQNHLNDYIASKIMAEKVLREEFSDLYTVILRPRGLIGIGDPSLVPRLLRANETIGIPLFHKGQNLVDITSVENVAYAISLCIEKENIQQEVFNITNDEPMPFVEILELFLHSVHKKPKYLHVPLPLMYGIACIIEGIYKRCSIQKEPAMTKYTICTLGYSQTLDIEKAKKLLGYQPRISLREEIERYGNNYQD